MWLTSDTHGKPRNLRAKCIKSLVGCSNILVRRSNILERQSNILEQHSKISSGTCKFGMPCQYIRPSLQYIQEPFQYLTASCQTEITPRSESRDFWYTWHAHDIWSTAQIFRPPLQIYDWNSQVLPTFLFWRLNINIRFLTACKQLISEARGHLGTTSADVIKHDRRLPQCLKGISSTISNKLTTVPISERARVQA
jgi:hypothetical protein